MKRRLRAAGLLAVAVILAACTASTGPSVQERAQGTWQAVFTSISGASVAGARCGVLAGELEVDGDRITGDVIGRVSRVSFDVTAIVSPAGGIDGGLAHSDNTTAILFGQISADGRSATGEWIGVSLCRGTWTARKQ